MEERKRITLTINEQVADSPNRMGNRRARTRGDSFYGKERPIFNANRQCIHISGVTLPLHSWSVIVNKGGVAQKVSGEDVTLNYTSSTHHSMGVSLTIGERNYMEDNVPIHKRDTCLFTIWLIRVKYQRQ